MLVLPPCFAASPTTFFDDFSLHSSRLFTFPQACSLLNASVTGIAGMRCHQLSFSHGPSHQKGSLRWLSAMEIKDKLRRKLHITSSASHECATGRLSSNFALRGVRSRQIYRHALMVISKVRHPRRKPARTCAQPVWKAQELELCRLKRGLVATLLFASIACCFLSCRSCLQLGCLFMTSLYTFSSSRMPWKKTPRPFGSLLICV